MQLTAGGRLQIWNAHLQRPSRSRSKSTSICGDSISRTCRFDVPGEELQRPQDSVFWSISIGATATLAADMRHLVGAATRPALASKRGVFQEVAGETVRVPLDSIAAP